jgi:hypothetical protein
MHIILFLSVLLNNIYAFNFITIPLFDYAHIHELIEIHLYYGNVLFYILKNPLQSVYQVYLSMY